MKAKLRQGNYLNLIFLLCGLFLGIQPVCIQPVSFFFFFFFLVFRDKVSLCSPGCPETHSVDQASLELRNLPASASQVLGLKACATTAWLNLSFKSFFKVKNIFIQFEIFSSPISSQILPTHPT
jgi:hypothetical protein